MVFFVVFFFFSSSRVFCHCIVFCLSLSVCLFATHVVNKDLYIIQYSQLVYMIAIQTEAINSCSIQPTY